VGQCRRSEHFLLPILSCTYQHINQFILLDYPCHRDTQGFQFSTAAVVIAQENPCLRKSNAFLRKSVVPPASLVIIFITNHSRDMLHFQYLWNNTNISPQAHLNGNEIWHSIESITMACCTSSVIPANKNDEIFDLYSI
jgi:hypothetical protein